MNAQIKKLGDEFVSRFWQASELPENIDKCELEASRLSKGLIALLREAKSPIISLDRVYAPYAPEFLEVTRRTDPQTGDVKISERTGSRPLIEQIEQLRKYKQIALVDVGAFEGKTLSRISEMLTRKGIEVREVYLGVSSFKIRTTLNGDTQLNVVERFNFYEWIELRDLMGIDGRDVGLSNGSWFTKVGTRLYMPYWQNLREWASIPEGSEKRVRDLCQKYEAEL